MPAVRIFVAVVCIGFLTLVGIVVPLAIIRNVLFVWSGDRYITGLIELALVAVVEAAFLIQLVREVKNG